MVKMVQLCDIISIEYYTEMIIMHPGGNCPNMLIRERLRLCLVAWRRRCSWMTIVPSLQFPFSPQQTPCNSPIFFNLQIRFNSLIPFNLQIFLNSRTGSDLSLQRKPILGSTKKTQLCAKSVERCMQMSQNWRTMSIIITKEQETSSVIGQTVPRHSLARPSLKGTSWATLE